MDVARQARSRTHARVRFENVLEELYVASEECALSSKDFFACQSGLEESVEYSDRPIVRSGHQTLDTITEQFTDLLLAADNLIQVARTQLYDSISIYGEDPDHLLSKDGGLIQMLSDFLPQLNQLSQFVQSAQQLAENLLLQIHGFLNLAQNEYPNTKEFPLTRMWRTLGDLLSTFIVLDELIRCHPFLHKHWTAFVHSIRLVQHNPGQFNLDTQFGKLQQLNSVIVQLDSALMNGNIFRDSCKMFSRFDYLTTNRPFMDRFRKVIVDLLARWEQLCTSTEQTMPNTQRLLCLLALSTLYHNLLPPKQQPDAKLVQKLCASYKLVIQFHLVGDLLFTPFEFILKQIPRAETVIDRKTISAVAQAKKCQLDRQLEQLSRDAQMFEQSVSEWQEKMATRFEECTSSSSTNGQPAGQDSNWELATEKGDLLVAGAHICDKINRSVKCILNGHLAEERPLSKQNARLIFRLIELLKSITNTFNAHWPSVLESAHCATTIYASSLLCLLEANIRTARSNSKYPFLVSALKNVEFAISLPANKRHLVLAGVSLELANYTRTLRSQSVLLDENLGKIDLFWDFGSTLARVANLSFLYWHRLSLMETYCSNLVIESEPDIQNAKNFFDAINYCAQLFHGAKHCSQGRLRQVFGDELFAALKKILLCKLCTEIENDLRISFHAQQSATPEKLDKQLLSSSVNEKGSQSFREPSLRLLHLLNIPRIRFGDKIVDVKDFVASYLNSTFYNLSVIALHDCESYRRMRILAHYRYGLQLFDPELPTRSVDQGLDIVTMLRNVDNFVDCYGYDLVEQFFIERESQGKQLGIVRVQQIVNSLKTHGTGVLNSLVNSAYKFLRSQFQSLLQYLFDEKIKSQLMHEIRFYRDSINQLEQMYPLGRAEKMANSFRRYKTADKGGGSPAASNFLDQFRLIVIRIGNALGLVRMFNAGIVEICAPNILLDFQQSEPMVDCVAGPVGNRVQFECAKLCDRISQNVWSNLRESGDCVELLTSVFAKEFRGNEKFAHLRYFFIIVPALMLAQVEHILKCRARLTNRRITGEEASSEFQFVEDGFSMGIAYLLTLLNQQFFFNSLNWFKSIFRKFRSELEKCAQEQKEAQRRKDESLVRILAVKMNQLKEQTAEFHQIMCTLNSALTFLSNEVGEEESNETYLEDF